jgi:hypothetical protein
MPIARPADATPRPPEDFAAVLATKEPVLLVGGQAVNLWALHYHDRTADLAPFTSRDADVLGDAETLAELGRLAGSKPQVFPLRPPTNEAGVVIAKDAAGSPMLIEVLRQVHGANKTELTSPVYTMALGENQVPVQVPGPIALLQAKLANVADLNQAGRQDGRHVLILLCLLPAYLAELQQAAIEDRLAERTLIEFLERLLAVVTAGKARKVLRDLNTDPRGLFTGLGAEKLPKLGAFLARRLPRALPSTLG